MASPSRRVLYTIYQDYANTENYDHSRSPINPYGPFDSFVSHHHSRLNRFRFIISSCSDWGNIVSFKSHAREYETTLFCAGTSQSIGIIARYQLQLVAGWPKTLSVAFHNDQNPSLWLGELLDLRAVHGHSYVASI